jgi:hypothetical protein
VAGSRGVFALRGSTERPSNAGRPEFAEEFKRHSDFLDNLSFLVIDNVPLTVLNGTAYFALPILLKDFPQLLRDHLNENPTTPQIESLGEQLIQLDFPPDKTTEFVKLVCGEWGGYPGIWGRVLKNNAITTICETLRTAVSFLAVGNISAALTKVNELDGLGEVSFASKHLKFLRPDICVVFDSILHDALPYTHDPRGYAGFCDDCASLARVLTANQIPNPRARKGAIWFASDVEAAVYIFARRAL